MEKVSLPVKTITQTYGFVVSTNQFGKPVSSDYVDKTELNVIEIFEREVLALQALNKPMYSMIELGSDQAYYSLLFKHILSREKTLNIMVEPTPAHLDRSKHEFEINNCTGVFYPNAIGTQWYMRKNAPPFTVPPITLHKILEDNSIETLDVLHSDIDGAESVLIKENASLFVDRRINCIFIATHSPDRHDECKTVLLGNGYSLLLDQPVGVKGDGWVIVRKV